MPDHEWITKEELADDIPAWAQTNLDFNNKADKAISKAESFVKAHLIKYGKYPQYPSEWTEILKLVVAKRSVYELYALQEQEEKAEDKKDDASSMLKALLEGGIAGADTGSNGENREFYPTAAQVIKGSTDWRGFKERDKV